MFLSMDQLAEKINMADSKANIIITADDKLSIPLLNMAVRVEDFNKRLAKLSRASQTLNGLSMVAQQLKPHTDALASSFHKLQSGIKWAAGFSTAVGAAGFGLVRFALSAVDAVDKVGDLAARYQVATASIQVWGGLVEEAGGSQEDAAASMGKLRTAMGEAIAGGKDYIAAFQGVGLTVAQLKSMRPEDIMLKMADAFKGSNNETAKHAVLLKLMGKNGTVFMDVMNQGGDAVRQRYQEMNADGRLFSAEQIAQADKFDKAWKRVSGAFIGFKNILGGDLANALLPIIEATGKWLEKNKELLRGKFDVFLKHLPSILDNVVKAAGILWDVFSKLADVFKTVSHAIGSTATVFLVIGIAMAPLLVSVLSLTLSLFKLTAALVSAVGPALLRATLSMGRFALSMSGSALSAIAGMVKALPGLGNSLSSLDGKLNGVTGKLGKLGMVGAAAFAGWELGTLINDKLINPGIEKLSGTKGQTLGGWIYDSTHQAENAALTNSPTSMTAAQAASTQKQQIDNTLRIRIDSENRPRVTEMKSSSSQTRLDVSTGLVMAGG